MFEYRKICEDLISFLPERTKNIIAKRFGIFDETKATLEAIGKDYGITRERVRQIEKDGIKNIRKEAVGYKEVFNFFEEKLEGFGGVKREETFIDSLISEKGDRNCVIFLLNIHDGILRFAETQDFFAFWAKEKNDFRKAKNVIKDVQHKLQKKKQLLSPEEISEDVGLDEGVLVSYLEISKQVVQNEDGFFGLYKWPEINPRGIKDRAYLIFKKAGRPLHFREVASMLGENANPQTTHNELIKDSRFVLVGRGVYALSQWGYTPGEVKEVIRNILKEEGSLHKNEIIVRVSKQRVVKKNTIIQNLSNKKYFIRTPDGKYTVA